MTTKESLQKALNNSSAERAIDRMYSDHSTDDFVCSSPALALVGKPDDAFVVTVTYHEEVRNKHLYRELRCYQSGHPELLNVKNLGNGCSKVQKLAAGFKLLGEVLSTFDDLS